MEIDKFNYYAFLYFSKNYTTELIKYIDDRENYNREFNIYASLTKASKYIYLNWFLIYLTFIHKYIVLNYILRNQITRNMIESVNYLMRETLNACTKNLKSVGIPLV